MSKGLSRRSTREADPAGRDGADMHSLNVIGTRGAVRDVPTALHHPLVGWDVIADEAEDHHDDVLGDADRIAIRDLRHRYAVVYRGLQVDVVGTNACGQREFQLLGLGDPLRRQIGRPKRLRDDDFSIGELALQHGIRAVLVGRDNEFVPIRLKVFSQAEFARDTAKKRAGFEVDRFGRRQRLAARIVIDLRQVIARVGLGVPVNRVVIKDANHLCHINPP